jgi:hypothetical protein
MEGEELRRIMQVPAEAAIESPEKTPLPPGVE